MENQGVTFNFDKKSKRPVSYTVTINGDQDDYIHTIKSLLELIRNVKEDMIDQDTICDVCDLITNMLPLGDQIINLSNNGETI